MTRADILRAYESTSITIARIDAQLAHAHDPAMLGGLGLRKQAYQARQARCLEALKKVAD